MTKTELIEKIRKGCDIMFTVSGRQYSIIAGEEFGFSIDGQYPNIGNEKRFDTAQELVNGYMINGVALGDLSDKVVITDYTLSGAE